MMGTAATLTSHIARATVSCLKIQMLLVNTWQLGRVSFKAITTEDERKMYKGNESCIKLDKRSSAIKTFEPVL